jgi:hypothetical protein
MITRIVFDGHACARAIRETAGKAIAAATTLRNWRRRSFMAYLCWSTLPFGNGNDTLVFASMATKNAAPKRPRELARRDQARRHREGRFRLAQLAVSRRTASHEVAKLPLPPEPPPSRRRPPVENRGAPSVHVVPSRVNREHAEHLSGRIGQTKAVRSALRMPHGDFGRPTPGVGHRLGFVRQNGRVPSPLGSWGWGQREADRDVGTERPTGAASLRAS